MKPIKIIAPKNEEYIIIFNRKTGQEILSGVNGNPDPFILESPNMIDVGIMGHCLNRCKICYQGDNQEPNMKLEDFREIMIQTGKHVNQVALGGRGDPNLHENFKEILECCHEYGVVPNYTTSGNNLTDEQVEITKKYCGAVAVSNYDKDFTYVAIDKFLKVNMKTNIHFVLTRDSFVDAIKIISGIDIWNNKVDINKLNAVVFLLFKPQGRGKDKPYLMPTDEQLTEFSNLLLYPKCIFKVGCDSCLINKVSKFRGLSDSEKHFVDTCEGGRMSCYISPNMMFMPCSFGDRFKDGIKINKDNSIQKIWESGEPFLRFRNCLEKNPEGCPYEL